MQPWTQYPKTRVGDAIMWAPEPTSPQPLWILGRVTCEKNQSCDAILFLPSGVTATKHDLWHADDPNCRSTPSHYREVGRGVFRLAPSELEFRELRERTIPALRREVADLRRMVERAGDPRDEERLTKRGRIPAGVQ
jgi:hypothetical protein